MSEQDASSDDGTTAEESVSDENTTADGTDSTGNASPETVDVIETEADGSAEDTVDEDDTEALVDRVTEANPADIAHELASLRTRIDGLEEHLDARESEVENLTTKLKRRQADFQNYKKRTEKQRKDERKRAASDLVTRLLDVRDNLVRALDQDGDTDIRGGVESTLRQFDDVLDGEGVEVIEPEPGADVDPHRHEVLVRVGSDQPEGTIADVHRLGYVMADSVLREAQVTVSEGSDDGGKTDTETDDE